MDNILIKKHCILKYAVLLFSLFTNYGLTQSDELPALIIQLNERIEEVDLGRYQHLQKIEFDKNAPYNVRILLEEIDTKKDNSVTQEFRLNMALLKKSMVRRVSSSKEMKVVIRSKEDLFQRYDEGEWDGYEDEVELMIDNADNAREVEKKLKEIIKLAKMSWENNTKLPSNINDLSVWLEKSLEDVQNGEEVQAQRWSRNATYPDIFELIQSDNKKSTNTSFSLGDLNVKSLAVDVKSDWVILSAKPSKDPSFILVETEGEQEYDDKVTIYAKDPAHAYLLQRALELAIPLCDSLIKLRLPKVMEAKASREQFAKEFHDFRFNEITYTQSINNNCGTSYKVEIEEKDDVKTTTTYKFHWGDLDPKSKKTRVTKEGILLSMSTNNKKNYIEVRENGALDAFENTVTFYPPDVEAVRVAMTLLDTITQACPTKIEPKDIDWLNTALGNITELDEKIGQKIELEEDCNLLFSRLKHGKTEEIERYEFNMNDIDINDLELKIRGKEILLNIHTKNSEKLISYYEKDGELSYEDEVELQFADVKASRTALSTVKQLAEQCRDK